MTWQTIETAPKDGTRFLGWDKKLGVQIIWWDDEFEYVGFDRLNNLTFLAAWTSDRVSDWNMQEVAEEHPTHWQPLPEGPQ